MTSIRRWLELNAERAQAFASFSKALQRSLLPWAEDMERTRSSVARSMEKAWALIDDFGARQQQLADRGWFVSGADFTPKLTGLLCRAIDAAEFDELDQLLTDHADCICERLVRGLDVVLPKRVPIVREAIAAHKEGRYTLSVPVLLAQADGLCYDIFQAKLFSFKGKQIDDVVRQQLKQLTILEHPWPITSLQQMFLQPVESTESLKLDFDRLDERRKHDPGYGVLNRQEILHGRSVAYATRPMSARTVLLLWYLLEIKNIIDQHQADAVEMSKEVSGPEDEEEP